MRSRVRTALLLLICALSAGAANYYVTVAGLGGAPEYDTQFAKWAADLEKQLQVNGSDAHLVTLSGNAATRQQVEQTLARIASEAAPADAFALFLIGHGTFDGTDYKINLPGPDMTGTELAGLLNKIPAQKNAPVFARYWIDGLRDPAADADKNGTVSALEAFRYAERKTAGYFESEKLLATEHALLTDTAKANAVRDPKPENGQGVLAAAFPVLRPHTEVARNTTPEKQKLLAKKQDLEAKIDRLKYQKAALSDDEYKQQLTVLLVELSRTQAEIDR